MHILTMIITTLGAAFFIFKVIAFRKRSNKRPVLQINIVSLKGYSSLKWESSKTTRDKTYCIYETSWYYQLIIRNISAFDAHYTKMVSETTLPHYSKIDELNIYEPIRGFESKVLNAEYTIFEECAKGMNTQPQGIPKALENTRFLLHYQNAQKVKLYTIFEVKNQQNTHYLFKPSEFN